MRRRLFIVGLILALPCGFLVGKAAKSLSSFSRLDPDRTVESAPASPQKPASALPAAKRSVLSELSDAGNLAGGTANTMPPVLQQMKDDPKAFGERVTKELQGTSFSKDPMNWFTLVNVLAQTQGYRVAAADRIKEVLMASQTPLKAEAAQAQFGTTVALYELFLKLSESADDALKTTVKIHASRHDAALQAVLIQKFAEKFPDQERELLNLLPQRNGDE